MEKREWNRSGGKVVLEVKRRRGTTFGNYPRQSGHKFDTRPEFVVFFLTGPKTSKQTLLCKILGLVVMRLIF